MFIDVKIYGKPIHAMIHTGVTHNYLASIKVERLGLVLEKGVRRVKAINLAAQPIIGVAKSMLIKIGAFEGKTNLSVVVMDDFKFILGLEFLRDTCTAVSPHITLMMLGEAIEGHVGERYYQAPKLPYEAPVLFQKKVGDTLHMCCDYRTLNKITMKNKYTIPLVADCFNHLSQCSHNLQHSDEPSTHGFLDKFVVVYLDDIVIYSGTLARDVKHLQQVLTRLREHELYPKVSKVQRGRIRMDPKKVQAIAPMINLLKKTETWNWTPQCQVVFDNLKRAMVTDLVLALLDISKPFVLETDALDFALEGILMQDGHPIAFESRKLKDVKRRYSVHD
ncbi:UNVERIFIED_CONTAM: Transposon Tf2-12 polyprotein [Sesamum radiatum]|uniref:Transposon Tf2-12 polyprotein n=1 Tax=Sesamum radiatum TaxID=300843 RepID=A0AAW2R284_SESRA